MRIPSYELPEINVFNYRQVEWNESDIIDNIEKMLKCGEEYDIRLSKVEFSSTGSTNFSEIKKTVSKNLKISVGVGCNNEKEINFSYEIPWLVKNYFYIGGNKKIPIYQLFDKPLITRDKMVKIRTNIQTVQMARSDVKKDGYNYWVQIFNKKVPLVHLIYALYGKESVENKFLEASNQETIGDNYFKLIQDLKTFSNDPTTNFDKILSKQFRGRSDKDIIENILLITGVDIFSKRYMETENIIDELIWGIVATDQKTKEITERLDDCSLNNKRIRFLEYFLYSFLCKDFYNMIVNTKKSKRDTYSNNSKIILVNANTSPIIQYESPLNPLDELARLSRVALTGPGGFKKDNIPAHLRDIHPSMYGKICPADTGDRENCGSLQYIVTAFPLNRTGLLDGSPSEVIPSISISHVPFLEHDDPTRLQMASSQMKHSIMLKDFDLPMIQSGIEGMYTDYSSYIFRAKDDGKVIYKNKDIIIVQYENGKCDAFNIGCKKSRLSIVDFYNTYFESEENNKRLPKEEQNPTTFKKGDIISESNYLNNGKLTIGRNFKTAIMTWYGYNFEDAIIISKSAAEKLTSLHYIDLSFEITPDKVLLNLSKDSEDYNPLPKIGQRLKRGDLYAIVKTIESRSDKNNYDVLFDMPSEKVSEEDCTIIDIKAYVNKVNTNIPQYSSYIDELLKNQKRSKEELINTLKGYLSKDELERFLTELEVDSESKNEEKYKMKGETIDGVLINMTGIYERPIQVGDKIGNRHGNKGVISKIVPDHLMPRTPDGFAAEVIINPLGIISRMNVGQLFELHLGMVIDQLKKNIVKKYNQGIKKIDSSMTKDENPTEETIELFNELESDIYEYVSGFISIIDKTRGNYYSKQMDKFLQETPLSKFIENLDHFYVIQPPFESIRQQDLEDAMKYVGASLEYPCFEPISKKNTEREVAFGYMYFEKLNHISEDKNAVRGIGPYASKTSQPLHGKSRKGGQRVGEMEIWSLGSHGARENLNEILTTKSDSIKKRDQYISDMMQNKDLLWNTEDDSVSQSLRILQQSLKTLGLDFYLHEEDD